MRNSKTFQVTFHHLPSLEAQMESVGAEFFSLRIPGSLSQRVKNFLQHSYTLQREAISETQVRKCGMAGMGPMGESLLALGPTEATRSHCCNRLYRHEMFSSLQLTGAFSLSLFFSTLPTKRALSVYKRNIRGSPSFTLSIALLRDLHPANL